MTQAGPAAGSPARPVGDGAPARRRSSGRTDVLTTVATNIAIAASNVVTGVLLARMLLPARRGEFAAIVNWPTILGGLATLGLAESLVYYGARAPRRAGRQLATSLLVVVAASVVLTVVGWFTVPLFLAAQSESVVDAGRLYLLQVPLGAVLGIAVHPLRGVGDMRAWNVVRTGPAAVWFVVVVVASTRPWPVEPESLAMAFLLARAALVPITIGVVRWRLREGLTPDRSLARPLLRFGVPSVLGDLPKTVNLRLDQLLIAAFLPPGDLGVYTVAVSWSMIPSPVMFALGNVLFPRVAEIRDAEDRATLAARGVRVAIGAAGVMMAGTALLAPIGLPLLFGPTFAVAVPTALVLTVAAGIVGVTAVEEEALRGLGRPVSPLIGQVVASVLTVVGLLVAVPAGKIFYVALVSVVAYTALAVTLTTLLCRTTHRSPWSFLIPRPADLAALRRTPTRPGATISPDA